MKKTTKPKKTRTKTTKTPSGRTATPVVPAAKRKPPRAAALSAATDAPVTGTLDFKAGKDL